MYLECSGTYCHFSDPRLAATKSHMNSLELCEALQTSRPHRRAFKLQTPFLFVGVSILKDSCECLLTGAVYRKLYDVLKVLKVEVFNKCEFCCVSWPHQWVSFAKMEIDLYTHPLSTKKTFLFVQLPRPQSTVPPMFRSPRIAVLLMASLKKAGTVMTAWWTSCPKYSAACAFNCRRRRAKILRSGATGKQQAVADVSNMYKKDFKKTIKMWKTSMTKFCWFWIHQPWRQENQVLLVFGLVSGQSVEIGRENLEIFRHTKKRVMLVLTKGTM